MRVFLIVAALIFPAFAGTNDCTIVKGTATNAVVRCEARTKSGAQCKRRAQKGKTLCRQHEKIAEKK